MKTWLIAALVVAVAATAVPTTADAKRLGAGRPAGLQRNMPARTAPDAPPPKPATPAQAQQTAPGAAAAAPGAAAAPKRSWMGPIAGLAAGLGIAALLSHFGMGAAAANFIMMLLIGAVVVFGVMFLLRRFGGGGAARPAMAGAHGGRSDGPQWGQQPAPADPVIARTASPSFEPAAPAAGAGVGTLAGATAGAGAFAAEPGLTAAFVPASFDVESFTRTAKMIFIRLQAANDTADLDDLRRFTTPELFASLRLDIQDRADKPQQTDVVKVEADVLDVANEADRQVVSVRFHGQVIEDKGSAPTDFNEVWHLVKPHDDSRPWAIAGIEQMA